MTPSAIAQDYLDEIAAAVMAGDYQTYRDGMTLPFHLITHTTNMVVATEDAARDGFEQFRGLLLSQRVTDYIRLVDSAQQLDAGLISARYVTHLIAGSQRIIEPFHSSITLRVTGNRWCAASITNALANSRWPLAVLRGPEPDPERGSDQ